MPSKAIACVVSSTERNYTETKLQVITFKHGLIDTPRENTRSWGLSHLKEGKILILVDLYGKNRVSRGLSKTTQTHLGIEEVHHGFLHRGEGGNYLFQLMVKWLKTQGWNSHIKSSNGFIILYSKAKCCTVPHLCDTKGDVAHVESASLPGHLAAHYRYRGGSNSQAIWSHGWQEGCGWDLPCSWRAKPRTGNTQQSNYIFFTLTIL